MKKIIYLLMALVIMGTTSFAQETKTAKGKPKKETTKEAKPSKTAAEKPNAAGAGAGKKLKKDGTPDMRHKENKEAAKPKPKLKKDGTPDMRHKENKEAAKKK